ncbi:MAG: hypothetical protein DHS20C18_24990 [Saprospiraceae bacterium]|nr:MAG: hypothetical protein DHS20C18_24990 [Saprospiraceae bacterium]
MKQLFRHPGVLLLFVLICFLIDFISDYYFGDQNGVIGKGRISKLLFVCGVAAFWAWLVIIGVMKKRIVFIQMAMVILLWGVLEVLGYIVLHVRERPIYFSRQELFEDDANLGYKTRANFTESKTEITSKGDTIYQIDFHSDRLGRRVNPFENCGKFYGLFLGGSFTFGEGVKDNETLPIRFQEVLSDFYTYNYGFCGYGPHHMLALLQSRNLASEIDQRNGFGLYVYIDDHLRRVYGNMSKVTSFGRNAPHFGLDGDQLIRKGNFKNSRPYWIRKFLHVMHYSYVFQYLNIDWPLKIKEEHYLLTGRVIDQMFLEYKAQFGNENFFVLIYPGESNKILSYIKQPEVKKLDYAHLFKRGEHTLHVLDEHPDTIAYKILADKLAEDLLITIPFFGEEHAETKGHPEKISPPN